MNEDPRQQVSMSIDESVSDAELVRDATETIWKKDVTQRQVEEAVGHAVRRARSDERRKLARGAVVMDGMTCGVPIPARPPETVGGPHHHSLPSNVPGPSRDAVLRELAGRDWPEVELALRDLREQAAVLDELYRRRWR